MNKNLTLIDADSICYLVGSCETLQEAIVKVDERIDNIVSNTNADYISLFISKGKYFRHDIYPEYKGNRKGLPPKWMRSIKSYLEEKYEANWMAKVEADDLVAYWMNKRIILNDDGFIFDKENLFHIKEFNVIQTMAAIDKDLLKSIANKHYNYTFKLNDAAKVRKKITPDCKILDEEMIKGWFEETDETYADNFIWLQMLMGDTSDGVVGIPRIGPVKAEKYMQDHPGILTPGEWVFRKYTEHFGITNGIYEFQKNYRLLHMLDCDEDFLREVGELPKFPKIIKIGRIEGEELLNF